MVYEPYPVPKNYEELPRFLNIELRRIRQGLRAVNGILLDELNAEPDKPRDGMIVLADGTNWNPGSGAGFYGRSAGAWVFLG